MTRKSTDNLILKLIFRIPNWTYWLLTALICSCGPSWKSWRSVRWWMTKSTKNASPICARLVLYYFWTCRANVWLTFSFSIWSITYYLLCRSTTHCFVSRGSGRSRKTWRAPLSRLHWTAGEEISRNIPKHSSRQPGLLSDSLTRYFYLAILFHIFWLPLFCDVITYIPIVLKLIWLDDGTINPMIWHNCCVLWISYHRRCCVVRFDEGVMRIYPRVKAFEKVCDAARIRYVNKSNNNTNLKY